MHILLPLWTTSLQRLLYQSEKCLHLGSYTLYCFFVDAHTTSCVCVCVCVFEVGSFEVFFFCPFHLYENSKYCNENKK